MDGIYYRINGEGTVSLVYGYDERGDVIIPESVTNNGTTYQVTAIGAGAFEENNGLYSVVIPNTVTVIDDHAFSSCESLTSVTIGDAVTRIEEAAFMDCLSLTNVSIPNSVTTIGEQAFSNCDALTSVTIGSAVTDIYTAAFEGCEALTSVTCLATTPPTIGSNDTFDPASYANATLTVPAASLNLYKTAFGWSFFSHIVAAAGSAEAYACYTPSNTTLTFYYDGQRSSREGTTYDLNDGNNYPQWFYSLYNVIEDDIPVTHVVFDPSFSGVKPTSTACWFTSMFNLQSITGLEHLNTQEVTTMYDMFSYCTSLTTLDLSTFNTTNVTDMGRLFSGCTGLTSLDVSNFNTAKVTRMNQMFLNCSSLSNLDLSSFNTDQLTVTLSTFKGCSNLTTIYVGSEWSMAAIDFSDDMFYGCTWLVGGMGTTYDENHVDATYAHIDGGPSNPGYFTGELTFEPCDVNGDVEIDVTDVSAIIAHVLGKTRLDSSYLDAANVNGDSVIDIANVTFVINMALGK